MEYWSHQKNFFWALLLLTITLGRANGQSIVRIVEGHEDDTSDYSGQIRQFSEIGPSGPARIKPRPFVCYVQGIDPRTDTRVQWQTPNGNAVPRTPAGFTQATGSELLQGANNDGIGLGLARGPDYNSPDGRYCCVITGTSQRRCVTLTTCPMLPFPARGRITYDPSTNVATHSCDPGYAPSNPERTCQSNNEWSGTTVTCELIMCPQLIRPDSGQVTITTYVVGGVATYTCNYGYTLNGTNTSRCEQTGVIGQWTLQLPTCSPVDCGPLNNPTNGLVTLSGTTFNNMATYSCSSAYTLNGAQMRTCQASGRWSNAEPTCDVLCPPHTLSNGMVTYSSNSDPPPVGTVATYSCVTGYDLTGDERRTCVEGTGWTGSLPVCIIVDCGQLNSISNGQVNTSSGTTHNQTVTYSCNTGYYLVGSSVRTCLANGTWSLTAPVCEFIPLSVGGTIMTNNSNIVITDIGEGASALTCHTELTTCCREQDSPSGGALGEWIGPDSNQISTNSTDRFYVTRQQSSISLNRGGSNTVGGLYCCVILRAGGEMTFCVQVNGQSGGDVNVGSIVGGVIVVLIAIAVVVVGVVIAILFARQRRHKHPNLKDTVSHSRIPPEQPLPYSTRYTKRKTDSDDQSTIVFVKEEGPDILEFSCDTHVVEGEEVYLRVKVSGYPPPTLTWYHDGKEVISDYATELDDDGGVTFPSVEAKHAGTYKLNATNSLGSVDKQVKVIVSAESGESPSHTAVDLGPVSVDQLGAYVTELHANSNQTFKENYKALDNGEKGHRVTVAKIPENKLCNRFGNIAVYDDNRIVLQTISGREDCQSDYVNACYVDGYSVQRKFIATQGPLPRTLVDFWRLIWQERTPVIVMLTNLKEGKKIKCQKYWPDSGSENFGPFTVTITDQQVLADYTIRTLKVTIEGEHKALKTTQFHFTAWPDHRVPDYATPILGFHRRVKSQHNPSKGPLLVHCSAGVGRTGTYIVIDNVLEQIAAEGVVDISGSIVKARNQRMKLVQTQDQYVFIHDAILESVTCGDTQINAGDLRRKIQRMSQVAQGKNCTEFQYQFQILEQVSPKPDEVISSTAQKNTDKNRGKHYLPVDHSRVIIQGEQPDYIHAVFAHGYKHGKAYIIAQNPLPSTIRNFWKVIYDRKCAAVVMLTPLRENGEEVCSKYWPENGGLTTFGEFTIDNLGEESNPGCVIRQLSVLSGKTKQAHRVTQFQILNWNGDGVCDNLRTVTYITEEVAKVQRRTGNKSIVVHCSDTATRSGMYCAIMTTIDRCKTEGVVDVFQVVKALRVHKPGAVPTVENYRNVFEAVLVYLESLDTYANFQN